MGWALRGSPQCARCRRLPESQTDPWYFRKMQVSMRDDWGSFIHGSKGLMGSHGPSSSAPSRTYPLGSPRRLEFCQYLWQHVSIINSLPLGFFYMPHIFEKLYTLWRQGSVPSDSITSMEASMASTPLIFLNEHLLLKVFFSRVFWLGSIGSFLF